MNKSISIFCVFCIPLISYGQLELKIRNEWRRVDTIKKRAQYENIWLLACTIEFKKKKTDQSFFLEKLFISWKGAQLAHVHGVLYKKPVDYEFHPFQEHLISESCWSQQEQQLVFRFNRPLALEAETTLCLVFSVPQSVESILKAGHFEFERHTFPVIIQESLAKKSLILAYR